MQVRLTDVVERAVDPTLEQREVTFDRVRMREPASRHVFLSGMVDAGMPGKFVTDGHINLTVVRHQVRLPAGVLDEDRPQVRSGDIGYMEALSAPVSLDQRHNRHLAS